MAVAEDPIGADALRAGETMGKTGGNPELDLTGGTTVLDASTSDAMPRMSPPRIHIK